MKQSGIWLLLACTAITLAVVSLMLKHGGVMSRNTSDSEAGKVSIDGQPGKSRFAVPAGKKISVLRKAFRDKDSQAVSSVVRTLSNREMEEALAVLMEMKPGWKLVRVFLSDWADVDPVACAGWVAVNLPKGGDRSFIMHYVLGRWAEQDVHKAFSWAQSLSAEQGRDSALQALMDRWAVLDPEAAANALATLKDFNSCNLAKGVIAWNWARKDINAATAWAWNLPKDSGYVYALYNIAMVLRQKDDGMRFSEWTKSFPAGHTDNPALRRLAGFLAGNDSGKTVSLLSEETPGGLGNMPEIQLFIIRWAKADPESAKLWAGQLVDGSARDNALYTIAQVLESGNKTAAGKSGEVTDSGQTVPGEQAADSTKPEKMSVSEILNQDLSVAVSLSEQLPDGAERDAVMHSIALRWAEDDPAGAAAWVIQQMPEGRELNVTLRTIVWSWAEKDSAGALLWVNQMADDTKQAESRATVAMALARTDPTAAAGIVEQMPCGESRNNVVSNVAFQWALTDRNAVTAWAQKLTVEQGKEQALAAIQRALNN